MSRKKEDTGPDNKSSIMLHIPLHTSQAKFLLTEKYLLATISSKKHIPIAP